MFLFRSHLFLPTALELGPASTEECGVTRKHDKDVKTNWKL